MSSERIWRAVHVYYYDGDRQDHLILDAVRPLLARLEGHVECAYFVPHWRRGPHVRIPILADAGAFDAVVAPATAETVGEYLRRHPSRATLPHEDVLLPAHERAARMEREDGPLRPLVPDNAIRMEPHDRRLHILEGEAGADLLASFYAATTPLAFAMLERIRGGASRQALSLILMLAVAHRHWGTPPHLRVGFVSFRSHAEAFLVQCEHPDRVRAAFDRDYAAHRDALLGLVHGVIDALDGSRSAPFAPEWLAALEPIASRAEALIGSGALTLAVQPDADVKAAVEATGGSALHRSMSEHPALRRLLVDDAAFKRYRLLLNYTYLHLARLGVTGAERYRLCHLAANAVEDALGVDAMNVIERYARRQDPATPA